MSKNNLLLALKYFIISQVVYWIFIFVAIVILPSSLWANNGFSFFGVNKATIIPYAFAIFGSAYFLYKTKFYLPTKKPFNIISSLIPFMIILMIGIVITPYTISDSFGEIHQVLGIILFAMQFVLSIWLTFFVKKCFINYFFFTVLLAGGLLSLFSILGISRYLIQGQIIFQLSYCVIFINLLKK